jgi:hypothetical protein
MKGFRNRLAALAVTALALLIAAGPVFAQGLYYKEIEKDGRVYVFNSAAKVKEFEKTGSMGIAVTMLGQGPNGETVVAENETAMDLYNLKHDRPGYERPAPKPAAAPSLPTSLKIGDSGELKFGLLLQAWYVTDDTLGNATVTRPGGGAAPVLGNTAGLNTFRLRRAEIKLSGKITSDWGFEVMFDPAKAISPQTAGTDGKILQDLAVTYLGVKGFEFSLGQKKITLTEEGVRSSSELDFTERAQITRAISDRRETGFFYKGDVTEYVTLWGSITNGTASNVLDDSNDTVNFAGRLDIKPIPGLIFGGSGLNSAGEGAAHAGRSRIGGHLRYDGTADLPLWVRFEYATAKDDSVAGSVRTTLKTSGWYGSILYTFAKQYQIGIRYDEYNKNTDVDPANRIRTITGGIHYLVKGKNLNLKAEYYNVKEENRFVNGVLSETYSQFILAAQAAF